MRDPASIVTLDLDHPPRLAGRRCGPLAAWFVALLVVRARAAGRVERHELRARLRTDGAYAMALSRLFAAAKSAGLAIGWGDARGDPSTCDPRRRREGPYWLAPAVARRVRITRDGQPMSTAALRRRLSLPAAAAIAPTAAGDAASARFWFDLLLARQQTEEDGTAAGAASASSPRRRPQVLSLASLAASSRQAGAALQQGWALFAQARQARRGDDLEAAREALQQAGRAVADTADPRSRALKRLCMLGLAWCSYQARDLVDAQRRLDRGFFAGSDGWRENPRLCAEVLNLRGLLRRARLAARWPRVPSTDEVAAVLADFEAALVAAIEADAFTLMEAVASNLGYSIWLLQAAPGSSRDPRFDAMRWILLSEWYRQRHALSGHSLWNVLSVCRIARGGLALAAGDGGEASSTSTTGTARTAGTASVLPLPTVRRELAPLGDLLHVGDARAGWPAVTERLLAELREAPAAHGRLESAAVMLEHLWQLAPGGPTPATLALARELRERLRLLTSLDRVMFERELQRIETAWERAVEISSTPKRAAPRTRASRHRA